MGKLKSLKKNSHFYRIKKMILLSICFVFFSISLIGQNPQRFDKEIRKFAEIPVLKENGLVVFTGSSSIRLWKDLKKDCDGYSVINTGFGGSQMSDLLFFIDQTVLRFQPDKVYIYEGDNDIAAEKSPEAILKTTKQVANKILESNPEITIHFISAKPSPSRWKYKEQYLKFNSLLKSYCKTNRQLYYINVWNDMLNDNRRPIPDIFISDSLHMNRKGYLLWKNIICKNSK